MVIEQGQRIQIGLHNKLVLIFADQSAFVNSQQSTHEKTCSLIQ